jgi:hypothetical protein
VKIQIVFLLAMIRQRLARNLSSSDTSTIREYRKEQGIHSRAFLKHIENSLCSLIHKRNCAHLNADDLRGNSRISWAWYAQDDAGTGGDLQKFAAIHI